GRPVDLEAPAAEPHYAVGDVAAHAEQRQRGGGERAGADHLGDVCADGGVAGVRQVLDRAPVAELERARQGAQSLAALGEPRRERRVAGVLEVVAPLSLA